MEQISKMAATRLGLPYTMRNGLVLYKNRVVIPPRSKIPDQLLREFHDSPFSGHSGVLQTHKRIAQQFTGHQCIKKCMNTSPLVMYVNERRRLHCPLLVSYNRYSSLVKYGMISLWTSSKAYLHPKAKT